MSKPLPFLLSDGYHTAAQRNARAAAEAAQQADISRAAFAGRYVVRKPSIWTRLCEMVKGLFS